MGSHDADAGLAERLRSRGLRLTPQRARVLRLLRGRRVGAVRAAGRRGGTSGDGTGFHRGRGARRPLRDVPRVPRTSRIGALMTASPLLALPGAVQTEGGTVPAHYGDPLREQRALAEGAGLVDRSDRDVLA